jgi:hypothetical protein
VYLFVKLRAKAVPIVLGLPAAVVVATVGWVIASASKGGMYAGIGEVLIGALAMIALPWLLAAIALVVWVRSLTQAKTTATLLVVGIPAAIVALMLLASALGRHREEALVRALVSGDLALVKARLRNAYEANACFRSFSTCPLGVAADSGQPRVVEYLLGVGVSVDGRANSLPDPVFGRPSDAESAAFDETAALLVDHGALVSHQEVKAIFAWGSHARTVAALERRLFAPQRIGRSEPELSALLWEAAAHEENDVVSRFLDRGGSADYRDPDGHPLLTHVLWAGNSPIARELMRRGADVTATMPGERAADGQVTAPRDGRIHLGKVDLETVKMFMARSPSVDLARLPDTAPLTDALARGDLEVAGYFMRRGMDTRGQVFNAVSRRDVRGLRWLLEHGVSANDCGGMGEAALVIARRVDFREGEDLLTAKGARERARCER